MLNQRCAKENSPRTKRQEATRLDLDHHDPPLTAQEAQYEASRCLGAVSCEACDLCRFLCPDLAITRDTRTGEILIDLDVCKGCGICAFVCPKGAINMVLEE